MTANHQIRNLRILVVEDDPSIRKLMRDLLNMDHHDVFVAADGESALKFLQSDKFDLLITDLGLPGISGWDLAEASKRYQTDLPIIAISSWSGKKAEEKKKKYGVNAIIWKPFRFDQIRQAIHAIFSQLPEKPSHVES